VRHAPYYDHRALDIDGNQPQVMDDISMVMDDGDELPQFWTYHQDTNEFILNIEDALLSNELSERNMTKEEKEQFIKAKVKELESFFENGVWEVETGMSDPARTMRALILLKWSKNPDGSPRAKARLVIQGFNDPDALKGELQTSSPTAQRLARMFVVVLARQMDCDLFTADVATAFLQGKESDRNLWVVLPKESCRLLGLDENVRMRLKKSMYDLPDAPRLWWQGATDRLLACGFAAHPLDPCLFLCYNSKYHNLDGMICIHVDDMLGCACTKNYGFDCFAPTVVIVCKLRLTSIPGSPPTRSRAWISAAPS
jgi:hypothetical protein